MGGQGRVVVARCELDAGVGSRRYAHLSNEHGPRVLCVAEPRHVAPPAACAARPARPLGRVRDFVGDGVHGKPPLEQRLQQADGPREITRDHVGSRDAVGDRGCSCLQKADSLGVGDEVRRRGVVNLEEGLEELREERAQLGALLEERQVEAHRLEVPAPEVVWGIGD